MTPRPACTSCGHRDPRIGGRCARALKHAICGCVCTTVPKPRPAEPEVTHAGLLVLAAVGSGTTWGRGLVAATGLSENTVYEALSRLRALGLLEREPVTGRRGSKPHEHRLTAAGSAALIG
jgi:hypothetical protein